MNFNNLLERLRITVGEKGKVLRAWGAPTTLLGPSVTVITLNPAVRGGICFSCPQTPELGFRLIFPEPSQWCWQCAVSIPGTIWPPGALLLLAICCFLVGFVKRVRLRKGVLRLSHGDLMVDPGLLVSPRPQQHLATQKLVARGTDC